MQRSGERGGANLKFVIVMAVLIVTAYAGYLYVPVAYQANTFKDLIVFSILIAVMILRPTGLFGKATVSKV